MYSTVELCHDPSGDPAERLVPRLQPILSEDLTMRLIRAIASELETRSSVQSAEAAPRGEKDEACANAGTQKVADKLK